VPFGLDFLVQRVLGYHAAILAYQTAISKRFYRRDSNDTSLAEFSNAAHGYPLSIHTPVHRIANGRLCPWPESAGSLGRGSTRA
jgi:hypothetical protein